MHEHTSPMPLVGLLDHPPLADFRLVHLATLFVASSSSASRCAFALASAYSFGEHPVCAGTYMITTIPMCARILQIALSSARRSPFVSCQLVPHLALSPPFLYLLDGTLAVGHDQDPLLSQSPIAFLASRFQVHPQQRSEYRIHFRVHYLPRGRKACLLPCPSPWPAPPFPAPFAAF